jgi:hypothetical protein
VRPGGERSRFYRRDYFAGGLMVLFGLVMAVKGPSYGLGTLVRMGPGFMPTVLGVILILIGIAIAGAAVGSKADSEGQGVSILPEHPEWWGWLCIIAGPVLFIVLSEHFGMIPATFGCVFVSALGDRLTTWKSALILAVVVTVFGVGLFSYVLQVPMPVLEWRLS